MTGKVLLPYQLRGLHGLGPERRVGFISRNSVEKLKIIGSAEGLAIKKLKGCSLTRAIDQGGTRVGSSSKDRIMVISKTEIQNEAPAEVDLVLSIDGGYL